MQPVASDFQITKTLRLQYLLHLPPDARTTSNARWPLILFLHGRGESGDDIEAVRREGLPPNRSGRDSVRSASFNAQF
jgi:predicted peptidase